jgi:phosphate transport system permease protein
MAAELHTKAPSAMDNDEVFQRSLALRNLRATIWKNFFRAALLTGVLALLALFLNILNGAMGFVILNYAIAPEVISPDAPLENLDNAALADILAEYESSRVPVYIRDYLSAVPRDVFTTAPLRDVLAGRQYDPALGDLVVRDLTAEQQAKILADNLDGATLRTIIGEDVNETLIVKTFPLTTSLFNRAEIDQELAEAPPGSRLQFKVWLDFQFLTTPLNTNAFYAGIRAALLGSLVVVVVTVLISFPIGLGAAIYLEEYASRSPIHRLIETNIRNLAGVPSIIYGLLGLAIFVRLLGDLTGGRSILSASLTMALLIMPVIIINAQEALRAVPPSMREASYGLGATKWQTIARTVLPAAIPGILTGTILAMSRAIGETAPLIVIGASTFIVTDPRSLTDSFTVLPIQIFSWSTRPQLEFRAIAASGIVILLVLLLTLNTTAIILRQRFRRKLTA